MGRLENKQTAAFGNPGFTNGRGLTVTLRVSVLEHVLERLVAFRKYVRRLGLPNCESVSKVRLEVGDCMPAFEVH
jgi:hypothetical protein